MNFIIVAFFYHFYYLKLQREEVHNYIERLCQCDTEMDTEIL